MRICHKSIFIFALIIFPAQILMAAEAPGSAKTSYNSGVDFYNNKEYNKAADNFLKATNTENRIMEQWSNYNLGNSYFQQAQKAEGQAAKDSFKLYNNAVEFFRRAIDLNPRDKDAKYNFELTQKKLKELEEKKKQESREEKEQNKQQTQKQEKNSQGEENKTAQQTQQEEKKEEDSAKQKPEQQQPQDKQNIADQKEMSKEEAMMLLNNFQQSEKEQKEILREESPRQEPDVEKDW